MKANRFLHELLCRKDKIIHRKVMGSPRVIICGECGATNVPMRTLCMKCGATFEILEYVPGEKGGERMDLFQVFMVYGENRDKPTVQQIQVVADSREQALLKSGLQPKAEWDFDYVTLFAEPICEVSVKEKPIEVASVLKK